MQPNEIIEVLNRPISDEERPPSSRGHPRAQAPETTAPIGMRRIRVSGEPSGRVLYLILADLAFR